MMGATADATLLNGLPNRAVYDWDIEETSFMLEALGMGQFKQQVRLLGRTARPLASRCLRAP